MFDLFATPIMTLRSWLDIVSHRSGGLKVKYRCTVLKFLVKPTCCYTLWCILLICCLTLCAVTANCSALFIMSAVLSSARPNRSPRSFRAWLAFCTALVTLSAAECSILLPADKGWEKTKQTEWRRASETGGTQRGREKTKGERN